MSNNLLGSNSRHNVIEDTVNCNSAIKQQLMNLREDKFQQFTSRLLPGVENILGVRLPYLRKLAKKLAKGDWRAYLAEALDDSYEEIMLQGMVIGYVKTEWRELIPYVKGFLAKIDNWSTCDSFCSGLKICKGNQEEVWEFLQPLFFSENEFEVRFAIVMLIYYYQEKNYIEVACNIFESITHEGYYVKMAVAWAISIYYVHFQKEMMVYLGNNKLDEFTYKKSIQKICESKVVSSREKDEVRNLL